MTNILELVQLADPGVHGISVALWLYRLRTVTSLSTPLSADHICDMNYGHGSEKKYVGLKFIFT